MRQVYGIAAWLAALTIVAGVVLGCGSSSEPGGDGDRRASDGETAPDHVRAAVSNLEEAARERDAPRVCRLLFSTDFLPAPLRRHSELAHLGLASEDGAPLPQYDADQRRCFERFGQRGEFSAFRNMPEVSSVRIRRVEPTQEISAVATAIAQPSPGGYPARMTLVNFRGAWRFLFVTR